jgi:periplasmic protein TonB
MAVAVLTSATAHAVALALVIALAPRVIERTSPPLVLPISLVSLGGGGGGGAPGAPEPPPPPAAAPAPEPTPVPDVAPPLPLPSPIVRPAKAPKSKPSRAAPAQVASVPSPNAQPGGVPGGTGTASGGDGAGAGTGFSGASPGYGVNPEPPYPLAARRLGYEGEVLLRVFVAADGRPTNVVVLKSSGHDMLDQSALETIRTRWRFVPARRNGVPVDDTVQVPIMFRRSAG